MVRNILQDHPDSIVLIDQVLSYIEDILHRNPQNNQLLKAKSIHLHLETIYQSPNYHLQHKAENLLTILGDCP